MFQPTSEPSRYSDSPRGVRSGDRTPVEERFSSPFQTGPEAHLASYTMGTGSFPGLKRPIRGVKHTSHWTSKLKKEETYHYTPSVPHGGIQGELYLHLFTYAYFGLSNFSFFSYNAGMETPMLNVFTFTRHENFSSDSFHISTRQRRWFDL